MPAVSQAGAQTGAAAAAEAGAGFSGTLLTGPQGAPAANTTKTLLGQ
jgi:hypothetical protein